MIVTRLKLKNWRNFREVDFPLRERQFIVGPNASGKSNLLDVFRFLRDIAKAEGGGLQQAVKRRDGLSKLRCLSARKDPEIAIEIHLANSADEPPMWKYAVGIRQETRGNRQPYISYERVWEREKRILDRPDGKDDLDFERRKQTFLEQVNANKDFRDIERFLKSITYLHLVPQLLRFADDFAAARLDDDPFGQGLLERIARTPKKYRESRLKKIGGGLQIAVPQFRHLRFVRDSDTGRPHLEALYEHWRPNAGWQREDQFSDGTLRLIGLLWALLEGESLLLLEEPELSLNAAIVGKLAELFKEVQRRQKRKGQVLVSTHSEVLLDNPGIDGREVLLLTPSREGSTVALTSDIAEVRTLLDAGLTVADVVSPRTRPVNAEQLDLL